MNETVMQLSQLQVIDQAGDPMVTVRMGTAGGVMVESFQVPRMALVDWIDEVRATVLRRARSVPKDALVVDTDA